MKNSLLESISALVRTGGSLELHDDHGRRMGVLDIPSNENAAYFHSGLGACDSYGFTIHNPTVARLYCIVCAMGRQMTDTILYKNFDIDTEFTLLGLQLFINQLMDVEGIDQNTVIDSIRLKFTNNLPVACLNECGGLIIND